MSKTIQKCVGNICITSNGVSNAEIIISAKARDMEKYAAEELRYHVKKVSGVTLTLNTKIDSNVDGNIQIVIATTDSYPKLNILFADDITWLKGTGKAGDQERYGDDGFVVRRRGSMIYIFGVTARGTLNGVYDFIEENLGIIWTRAEEGLGLIYEEMPTITVTKVDYREKSPFVLRGWHLCGVGVNGAIHSDTATEVMMARNKLNAKLAEPVNQNLWEEQRRIGIEPFHLSHNISNWILQSPSYDESYMGYWNTNEFGKHYSPNDCGWEFNHPKRQINYWDQGTDSKTLQTVIDSVLKFLADNPDAKCVGVGVNDTGKCTQIPEQNFDFEYAEGKFVAHTADNYQSTVCFSFINKVAQAVAKKYPNVYINAYAYSFAQKPPECVIESNICVVFAPVNEDLTDMLDASENITNKRDFEQLKKWISKTSNIVIYNYYGSFSPSASYERPIAERIKNDMLYYASKGLFGVLPEGVVDARERADSWAMNTLTFWLYSKLAWNPNEDINALTKKFCDKSYGKASTYMQEYYAYVKEAWNAGKTGVQLCYSTQLNVYLENFIKNCGFVDKMLAALEHAWNVADDIQRQRILHIKKTFERHVRMFKLKEEEAVAIWTNAGKDAIFATINLEEPFAHAIWSDAVILEQFMSARTLQPELGKDVKVRLLWDEQYLYVAYENFDDRIENMITADFNEETSYWLGPSEDIETFLATHPQGRMYSYFSNPRSICFRYYKENGKLVYDSKQANWDVKAKVFNDKDDGKKRWVVIQAISFEGIGIVDSITPETKIYGTFFRDCNGTGIKTMGWNGTFVWKPEYLRCITLRK